MWQVNAEEGQTLAELEDFMAIIDKICCFSYDTFAISITQQKSQSGCSEDICDALLGLQSRIIDIKQRMQQVQYIHSGIVDELKSIEAKAGNFPASSSFKDRDTVGLDNRIEELLDLLIEGPPQLSVVAVLDSIGLDKTAFAAEAYNSNYVKHYFDCRAWVQESLPYDADQLLYDIIKLVMPSRRLSEIMKESSEMKKIILHEYVMTKRYLIVLDNFENGENIGLDFVPTRGPLRVTYKGWPFYILYHRSISQKENIEEALDEPRGLQVVAYCMLPFYLKLFCLYLSVFPVHFDICTKQLYQLWIAEGFIPDNNEAAAEKYLEQLINGGFVDAGKRSDISRINTCSIPGRCSPALLTVAFEGEFIISPIMDQEVRLRENVKRFTAHEKLNDFGFLDDFDSFLHSLLYLTSGSQYLDPTYCEKICKMFKFLRVLNLGSLLNIPSLKSLPSSLLSSLLNLYTLDMPFSYIDHTADEFWKVSKLRYLNFGAITLPAHPGKYCNSLENLNFISALHHCYCTEDILGRLLVQILILSCLESLKLANESKMPRRSNIILAEYQFPPSLTHLSFSNIELMDDPMPALEKLPVLQVLKLKQNSYSGRKLACSSDGFPKLKVLHLKSMLWLEEWTMGIRAMPKLECLIINPCAHLKGFLNSFGA
ncbi:hypothetical protein CISIN_1g048216mg [Citrus sinensis]|uniref:Uncharacterized protein n=1 Tax=Citrus sinensis TaxID=2711 RepID=A0A067DAA1_CITSI|nr:hypothetical protein CISIN_1g048216mg [Citrus sinensis]